MRNAFFKKRLWRAVIYFAYLFFTILFVGLVSDYYVAQIVEQALRGGTTDIPGVLNDIAAIRWGARFINVFAYSIGVYLLLDLILRPVKDLIEAEKQFIHNVSHELRTPLTVLKAEMEVALKTGIVPEELPEFLENNITRIDHISRIIQFFLILSNLESPNAHDLDRPLLLDDVVKQVLKQLEKKIEEKHVAVTVVNEAMDTTVIGNPIAVEKMILNLIRNAITYTPENGTVTITMSSTETELMFSVADEGPGIPEHELPLIFEPFYRASNAAREGTGIGLSIVREVARLHRARIRVASEQGKGTTFFIAFTNKESGPSRTHGS